jgi:sec-independent protein translocase protein TatC
MEGKEQEMSFWDHLEALRWVLFRSAIAVAVCMIAVFCCKEWVFDLIFAPKMSSFFMYKWLDRVGEMLSIGALRWENFNLQLVNFELTGQFMIHLNIAFWLGLIVSAPYIAFELWRFVSPALYPNERHPIVLTFVSGGLLFFVGVAISYMLIFPVAVRFFFTYHIHPDISNMISLSSYISLFTTTLLCIGAVFELPIVVFLLSKLGILKRSFMRRYRKHAIVMIAILAGFITPADPFTMIAVCIPLVLLYEASIYVCKQ